MNSLAWVFVPPEEALKREAIATYPKWNLVWTASLALLSYAVAETLMVPSASFSPDHSPVVAQIFVSFLRLILLMFLVLGEWYVLTRYIRKDAMSYRSSMALVAVALTPLHLALPIALLCKPLGLTGIIVYTFANWSLWLILLRRMAIGFQEAYQWPLWGGWLLVISPLLIAVFFLILIAVFLMAAISLSLLGLTAS